MLFLLSGALNAQPFNSGSTGAYGPLNITSNTTLDLPADGIFNCTTITIATNTTLQFNRNPLNTPVHLLAAGDVNVAGVIDVSGTGPGGTAPGQGGPGGFDGGYGGYGIGDTAKGGDGQGPGAGKNFSGMWQAFFGTAPNSSNTNSYGNVLLSPLIGGSGGGGTDGDPGGYGGGGGGAILIASSTRITIDGGIYADGWAGAGFPIYGGAGSGGGIRLVAPMVNGSGKLRALSPYYGSSGRVRIDCQDRLAFRSLNTTAATVTRGSQMFVFPQVVPRLDILQAAGQTIPEGAPNGVQIELPVGSPTNQTVVIQGRNFTGLVPITVAITPETGPSAWYPGQLDMSSGNPAQTTVNVTIPAGVVSRLLVWTTR
jgi:hypothetical protein